MIIYHLVQNIAFISLIGPILESRAEILALISLLFLENLRHYNFVLRLSDLYSAMGVSCGCIQ